MKIILMKRPMNRLFKIKKRIKKKNHPPVKNEPCKNCGTVFSGHYCPECGQSEKEVNRPFSIVFYDFLGNIFAFDTRFWKTFVNLIFRPGFLTKEFFEGRRVRYAPPMRFFVFASFVLFLLLQIFTNRGVNSMMYDSNSKNSLIADTVSQNILDSIISETGTEIKRQMTENIPGEDTLEPEDMDLKIDLADLSSARDFKDALDIIGARLEKQLESETDPEKRAKLIRYINLTRSPQHAINRILKFISWAFFLLLPVFALLLKLFYIRREQYYIRHLIFSIHFHSFVFLVFIVITLLYGLTEGNTGVIALILLCTVPVYFIIALKKFYGQGIGKVLLKFIGISFIYNIIFWLALSLAFLNALNIV